MSRAKSEPAQSTIVIRKYDRHGATIREPRDTRKHVTQLEKNGADILNRAV